MLQFEFDAGVITSNSNHRNSNHRRLKPFSSPTSIPPLASISANSTTLDNSNRPPVASISAKTTKHYNTISTAPAGTILPVGLKRGPHPRRYLWDGHRLVAVELSDLESVSSAASALATENENQTSNNGGHGKHRRRNNSNRVFIPLPSLDHAIARWLHGTRAAFFPNPNEVTPDYWEWCKWRAAHRIFSSMASVFGTQSLLLAVGVGAKRTLPAAAAINWVLKDGLGRLGRLSVATKFGESFDSDLKRFRFSSSLLYAASLSLDFLTPLFPQYFLPMASIANVGKSVGLTTYISTQPAFHRSFAVSENLADISAKSQAQQMAVDTIGLAVAVTLSALCARNSESARRLLPLIAFPFLAGGDLMAISNELRSIHLRTLNKERAEIIAAEFVSTGKVATPENVSAKERLILPPACSLGVLPLSFGGLEQVLTTGEEVEKFLTSTSTAAADGAGSSSNENSSFLDFSNQKKQKYALKVVLPSSRQDGVSSPSNLLTKESGNSVPLFKGPYLFQVLSDMQEWAGCGRKARGAVHAALRTDASPEDVLEIILKTAKLRRKIQISQEERKNSNVVDSVDVPPQELTQFVKKLSEAGWQVAPFMLSSAEKKFYCEMN